MNSGNLFSSVPAGLTEEFFETLTEGQGQLKIERIVSSQQLRPADKWYDQTSTEWVAILIGSAELEFKGETRSTVTLTAGDWLEIPPHTKHRVKSVDKNIDTVWLAIHWES